MIKVYKFGGAILNNIYGFQQLAKIISKDNNENKIIIVISAFAKTTANLEKTAVLAEHGDITNALNMLNSIFEYHINLANELKLNSNILKIYNEFLEQEKEKLQHLIQGVYITQVLTPRTKDMILCFGELIASKFISLFLINENIKNICFNISDVLVADNNFGNANPNIKYTQEKFSQFFLPVLNDNNCIVTQGFIASTITGEAATMGMESSNLSAAIIAGILKADEFVIWTDVEGIRDRDPKLFKETNCLANINYDFAEVLALYGVKLIYHKMITYLRLFNLSVKICSGLKLDGEFTTISSSSNNSCCDDNYKILIYRENLYQIYKPINNNHNIVTEEVKSYFINNIQNQISITPNKISVITDVLDTQLKNTLILNNYQIIENVNGFIGINLNINDIVNNNKTEKYKIEEVFSDYDRNSNISKYYFLKNDNFDINNIFE